MLVLTVDEFLKVFTDKILHSSVCDTVQLLRTCDGSSENKIRQKTTIHNALVTNALIKICQNGL